MKIAKGGNQEPYIEEGQTIQQTTEKGQIEIKTTTLKTKGRARRIPLKSGVNLGTSEL